MSDEAELVITIGIYFGRGSDTSKESYYYTDFERTNPADTASLQMSGDIISQVRTNFENATKYDLVFKIKDGSYAFDRAEISQ
jgi:hypothetical protein